MATTLAALTTTAYVKVNTGKNPLMLQSLRDDVRLAFSATQPAVSNSVFHTLGGNDDILQLSSIDVDLWALATSSNCSLVVTENEADQVSKASVIDSNNSARTPDISAPTDSSPYTGDWSFNDGFDSIQVTMSCDAEGTLYFDFYDVYDTPTGGSSPTSTFPVAGFAYNGLGFNEFHQAVKGARWFRVRFVPDDATATTFRINSYLLKHMPLANIPANQALARDQDGIFARSSITQDEISVGLRAGVSQFNKFGYRDDTTAAAGEQTVWANNTNFVPMKTADTLDITYNATTDGSDAGATGAKALTISYLDANEKLQTTTHILGDTGSDVTAFTCLGTNRVVVTSSGSSDTNVNNIDFTETTSGNEQATIPAGGGVTQQAIFFAPDNATPVTKFLWINCTKLSGGGAPKVAFKGYVYSRIVDTQFEIFRYTMDTGVENTISIKDPCNFPLSPRDVLWFTMDTDTNSTIAKIRFSTNLYDNEG